jgi:hypothetical protein
MKIFLFLLLFSYVSWISLKSRQMLKRWRISSFNGALPGRTSSLTWTPALSAAIASVYSRTWR